jgi:uncharacterized protein (DUF2249 family)
MTDEHKTVVLDVREEIRQGGEPFQRIMTTVNTLDPTQDLELWAPFEPQPLFGVLAGMGFQHEAQAQPDGDWRVRFFRAPAAA